MKHYATIYYTLCFFCICTLLPVVAEAQTTLHATLLSEKTYPNNTRTCYFKIDKKISVEQKNILQHEAEKHQKIKQLSFFDDNKQEIMFKSSADFTMDSVANFIETTLAKYLVQNIDIGDEVPNNVSIAPAPANSSDCSDAASFCTSDQYEFPAAVDVGSLGRIGCLGRTPNPAWYWLEIEQPGDLQVNISSGADVDFIAWGPFTSVEQACEDKLTTGGGDNHDHASTNGYPHGNIVDCCYCTASEEDMFISNAQTGEVYLLLITNYDNVPTNIQFEKTGGSATTNCGIVEPPVVPPVTPPVYNNGPLCEGGTLQLTAQTNNLQNAVYNWTGPNGFTSNEQNPVIYNVTTANAGVYTLTVTTPTGTGNPETTEVTINLLSDPTFINAQICENDLPYVHNGVSVYNEEVNYLNFTNAAGCDSVVVLDLTIYPIYYNTVSPTICEGDFYPFNGVNYYNSIITSYSLPTINGCDSIFTLNLTVRAVSNETIYRSICEGKAASFNCINCPDLSTLPVGNYLFTDTLQTKALHCDSIVTFNITINPIYNDTVYETICEGEVAAYHCINCPDIRNLTAGNYFFADTLHTINNCDSIKVLNLTINRVYRDTIYTTICEGETCNFYGVDYSVADVYSEFFRTQTTNCDSIITLNLAINPVYNDTIYMQAICEGEIITGFNCITCPDLSTLSAGNYFFTDMLQTNLLHCDSIVTFGITVNPVYRDTVYETICEGEVAVSPCINCPDFRNLTSGNYFFADTLPTIHNCDSIKVLNLTVNKVYRDTIFKSICEGETYTDQNFTGLRTAGIYTDTLQSFFQCDSIIILNLSKNFPSDTTFITDTVCSVFLPYTLHGISVSRAGRHYFNPRNIFGCDSVIVLDLEVVECDIAIAPLAEICANDILFTINYSVSKKYIKSYSIVFNSKAIGAGFQNISNDILVNSGSGEITVPLPQLPPQSYVRPDNYSLTFEFLLFNDSVRYYPFDFTILYPSWIIKQKWNNVLALLNKYYNGGYEFSSYQWYKNGELINGEKGSYIYVFPQELDFNACYRALLTRQDDGVSIMSCCLQPVQRTNIYDTPLVINSNGVFAIKSQHAGTAKILSVMGVLVGQQRIKANSITEINITLVQGMYILEYIFDDGSYYSDKIVVK